MPDTCTPRNTKRLYKGKRSQLAGGRGLCDLNDQLAFVAAGEQQQQRIRGVLQAVNDVLLILQLACCGPLNQFLHASKECFNATMQAVLV